MQPYFPAKMGQILTYLIFLEYKVRCFSRCMFSYFKNLLHFFQDLAPYLGAVVPGLKQALLDPVPEVTSCNDWKFSLYISRGICHNHALSVRSVQYLPAPSVLWSAVWVRRVLRICYLG